MYDRKIPVRKCRSQKDNMKFSSQGVSAMTALFLATSSPTTVVQAQYSFGGGIKCIGMSLESGGPNQQPPSPLEPNQWLCDPDNTDTRFGMNVIGMPMLYVHGKLVWHVGSRGTSLQLHTENTNLGLYGEGMTKWTTSCNSNAMGGSVVLSEDGELKLLNGRNELVWAIRPGGEEYLGQCIIMDEEDEDYAAIPENGSGGSGDFGTIRPGIPIESINKDQGSGDAIETDSTILPEANEEEGEEIEEIGHVVEENIATVDVTKFTCVGSEFAAGNALSATQYICDPNDNGNRFGLSYFGMPTFYKNGVLIWWKDTTGERLVFQQDGHLVLEGYGINARPKWSTGCFEEKEEVGSDSFVGGEVVQFVGGEVKILDTNAVLMWRLDAAGDESKCYPYGKKQTMNRANPFLCTGKALGPDEHLEPHEFICDPFNDGNRFGLSASGFAELYRDEKLVWRSDGAPGNQLWFSYDDAEFVLREEGETKWTTGCKSASTGKKVKFTPSGVKALDKNGVLVWALSFDGFATNCFPLGGGPDEDENEDENEAENKAIDLPDNCKGYTLKVGEILRPNEFLCDPSNPSWRFGLSFIGMPQLLRGDQLVWFVPARGDKLVYQEDGHLVLYGEGAVKWSTQCYGKSRGRQIDFVKGGIDLLDQDWSSVWRLDSNGLSSGCYPGPAAGFMSGL